MIIGNLWGLLGLLTIPSIIGLHIFRRRFQARRSSALFLFGPEVYNQSSGRTRERLRSSKSLWAELCAALALTWFLSDPHFDDQQQARHLIFLLDGHQRLQALNDDGISSHDKSKQHIYQIFDQLDSHDRITLLQSGVKPQLLSASAIAVNDAKKTLGQWSCNASAHDMRTSFDFALDLQQAGSAAHVIVISDQIFEQLPEQWQSWSFGSQVSNNGIIDARWLDDEKGSRLSVRVLRFNDQRPLSLQLKHTGAEQSFALDTKNQQHLIIPLAGVTAERLQLTLNQQDAAAYDNTITLLKPRKRLITASIEKDMPGEAAIQRALLATKQVSITDNAAHVRFCSTQENPQSGTWQMLIQAADDNAVIGPFLARSGHPLLQDIDFNGVLWQSPRKQTPAQSQSLLQAGNACLISAPIHNSQEHMHWHVDLEQSTLTKHPAWPSLFANLVQWRLQFLPGMKHSNLSTNMQNRIVLPPTNKSIRLQFPDSSTETFLPNQNGVLTLPRCSDAGMYQIFLDDETQAWHRFMVHHLHNTSSDFSACTTLHAEIENIESDAVQRIRTRAEFLLPLIIACLAAFIAWKAYQQEQGTQH